MSLRQRIYFFTVGCSTLFIILVMSVIYSTQVVEQALERQAYAKNIEDHANRGFANIPSKLTLGDI